MGFDFSPVVVFLLLGLLKRVLVSVLWSFKQVQVLQRPMTMVTL